MKLVLDSADIVSEMFVFHDLVVVRLDSAEFKFFPIPLVAGGEAEEVPLANKTDGDGEEATTTSCVDDFVKCDKILAYGMYENTDDIGEYIYELYAALETQLVKVEYQFDLYANNITQNITETNLLDFED